MTGKERGQITSPFLSGDIAPLGQAQIRGLELALEKRGDKISGH